MIALHCGGTILNPYIGIPTRYIMTPTPYIVSPTRYIVIPTPYIVVPTHCNAVPTYYGMSLDPCIRILFRYDTFFVAYFGIAPFCRAIAACCRMVLYRVTLIADRKYIVFVDYFIVFLRCDYNSLILNPIKQCHMEVERGYAG
jgi:hypothetical protein